MGLDITQKQRDWLLWIMAVSLYSDSYRRGSNEDTLAIRMPDSLVNLTTTLHSIFSDTDKSTNLFALNVKITQYMEPLLYELGLPKTAFSTARDRIFCSSAELRSHIMDKISTWPEVHDKIQAACNTTPIAYMQEIDFVEYYDKMGELAKLALAIWANSPPDNHYICDLRIVPRELGTIFSVKCNIGRENMIILGTQHGHMANTVALLEAAKISDEEMCHTDRLQSSIRDILRERINDTSSLGSSTASESDTVQNSPSDYTCSAGDKEGKLPRHISWRKRNLVVQIP